MLQKIIESQATDTKEVLKYVK